MTHPPEPIPDLTLKATCDRCSSEVEPLWSPTSEITGWRCDHCRITWTPDGTGGEQT